MDSILRTLISTEVGSSLTAVRFYRKMGYEYKGGVTKPDQYGVVRLEKRRTKEKSYMEKVAGI